MVIGQQLYLSSRHQLTRAFNFLAALMYTQLFTLLQNKANLTYKDQGMTLPHKVWFIWMNLRTSEKFRIWISRLPLSGPLVCFVPSSSKHPLNWKQFMIKLRHTIVSNCSNFTVFRLIWTCRS